MEMYGIFYIIHDQLCWASWGLNLDIRRVFKLFFNDGSSEILSDLLSINKAVFLALTSPVIIIFLVDFVSRGNIIFKMRAIWWTVYRIEMNEFIVYS